MYYYNMDSNLELAFIFYISSLNFVYISNILFYVSVNLS